MFYAQFVLSKKGPLAKIWLAAHWEKKLTKAQVFDTNIDQAVESILEPKIKMALRTTGHLLLGVVRIYSRKAKYLLADCNEAFIKIKMAFRTGTVVDLPEEAREANLNAITLPEVFHDFDSALPDFNDFDYQQQLTLNQSRFDDITMKEDVPTTSYAAQEDDFGGDGFDSLAEFERENLGDMDENVIQRVNITQAANEFKLDAGMPMDIDAPIMDDGFGGQLDDNLLDGDLNFFEDPHFDGLMDANGIGRGLDFGIDATENLRKEGSMIGTSVVSKNKGESTIGTSEVTTLIQNEEESFALEPLDATAATGLEKHRTKRKRRLIVDEVKAISGDDMKNQLNDFTDTIAILDLAPPTKKLMGFKESGVVDKLFAVAGLQFASKQLLKILSANIAQRAKKEDAAAEGALVLEDIEIGRAASPTGNRGFASPILEDVLGEENRNSGADDLPQRPIDDEANEDLAANIGGNPPSVSPQPTSPGAPQIEEPPSVFAAPASPRKERRSKSTANTSKDESFVNEEEAQDTTTGEDESQWSKRTQQVLGTIRTKLKKDDYVTFVDLCARKDNRKIAARKFYTLLSLKKLKAIEVEQSEPYGEIRIRPGPMLNEVVVA